MTAHEAQPMQASGLAIWATGYPLLFTSEESESTSQGQEAMQTPQPLHRSLSITIVPLILAIISLISVCIPDKNTKKNVEMEKKKIQSRHLLIWKHLQVI